MRKIVALSVVLQIIAVNFANAQETETFSQTKTEKKGKTSLFKPKPSQM